MKKIYIIYYFIIICRTGDGWVSSAYHFPRLYMPCSTSLHKEHRINKSLLNSYVNIILIKLKLRVCFILIVVTVNTQEYKTANIYRRFSNICSCMWGIFIQTIFATSLKNDAVLVIYIMYKGSQFLLSK
jgi:hypothetical protein